MTDLFFAAAELRELLEGEGTAADKVQALQALLPRPTLADMTPEERAACRWMQCDVKARDGQWVIANPFDDDEDVGLIDPTGDICWRSPDLITPRPDLPRLEWPGDAPTGPNDVAVGTVIESADDPRIDALPLGSILLDREGEVATNRSLAWTGRGYVPIPSEGDKFGPWTVLHIPKEDDQ